MVIGTARGVAGWTGAVVSSPPPLPGPIDRGAGSREAHAARSLGC